MARVIMYRDALREALDEEMARDATVFCMGEGIGLRGGSYKVTFGLMDKYGKERVIDTPISEAAFTGAAVGAAIVGARPVFEHLFIDFSLLAMDQIINQAAKYHMMSGAKRNVPLVMRTQGGAGNGLAAQHSQSLEALYYHIPGLKVITPATPYDAKGLLKTAIRDNNPVICIEHKLLYMTKGEVPEEDYLIPFGSAVRRTEGDDVTMVSYSRMFHTCLEASQILKQKGIKAEIIDLRTLVPMDMDTVIESVKKTGRCVVVSEACERGSVASDIAARVADKAFDYLDSPVKFVAGLNTPIPFNIRLEKAAVPSADNIVEMVETLF